MGCKAPVKIGDLRTPVTFQRETRTSDGAGGFTKTWGNLSGAAIKAHVRAVSGGERWRSDRIEANVRYRLTCRYFDGLTEADTVVFKGSRHNIRFINNVDMADKWLIIELSGGVAT